MDRAIREAGMADAATLARFAAALWRDAPGWPRTDGEAEARMRLLLGAGYRAFLLYDDGAPVAYALTRENGDHVFIRHFLVAAGATGRGHGRRLVAALDDRFDHPEFRIGVSQAGAATLGFWRRMGFADDAVDLARPPADPDEAPADRP
jgi:GNAT superfamily N-acetyltransferase